jgi:hypothetical protein
MSLSSRSSKMLWLEKGFSMSYPYCGRPYSSIKAP